MLNTSPLIARRSSLGYICLCNRYIISMYNIAFELLKQYLYLISSWLDHFNSYIDNYGLFFFFFAFSEEPKKMYMNEDRAKHPHGETYVAF